MTTPLDAMMKAMIDELTGSPSHVEVSNSRSVTLDGVFDLEAVARAALTAIREPSDEMIKVARYHDDNLTDTAYRQVFAAMIDKALE